MRKIGVIGLGHVGSTVAYTLVTKGIADELVLIDNNDAKCTAEFYDYMDSLPRLDTSTKILKQDYSDLADADVIVTSFGDIKALAQGGDRFLEYEFNCKQAKEVGIKLHEVGFKGVLINISNPCDVITGLLRYYTGLNRRQVFGTGTFLDTARMQRAVGMALNQNPHNISGYVLGEHGESQFTAWSTVCVQGKPIEELAEEVGLNLGELDNAARGGGWLVFNGKKYTCYAIATCAVKLVQAVFSDSRLVCPASVYVDEFKCYVGYPAIITKSGAEMAMPLPLSAEEKEKLTASAKMIRTKTEEGKGRQR